MRADNGPGCIPPADRENLPPGDGMRRARAIDIIRNPLMVLAVLPAASRAIWLATQGNHDRIWFTAAVFFSGFATAWIWFHTHPVDLGDDSDPPEQW